jgi:hypothetical protein
MRLARHSPVIKEMGNMYKILIERAERAETNQETGIDGGIILTCTLKAEDVMFN